MLLVMEVSVVATKLCLTWEWSRFGDVQTEIDAVLVEPGQEV